MPSPAQYPAQPPVRRWQVLLVLGLLAGLLGMHALAPGGLAPDRAHSRPLVTSLAVDDGDCSGGRCGGCVVQHADSACVSAAVAGGPELPAPTPDPVTAATQADAACSHPAGSPDAPRAPPSLAELQLLRI
ncbi:DUF6153 family protein [Streptomyces sp. NPDC058464]|uniref:DUF6153 family protein n=1 Tax=Streptomyces sp. NPDC058464 TaxID=3346511 RepID=UPI003663A725